MHVRMHLSEFYFSIQILVRNTTYEIEGPCMHVLLCWLIFRKVIINSLADRFQKFDVIIRRWAVITGDSPFYTSVSCKLQFELVVAAQFVFYPCTEGSGSHGGLYHCHFTLDFPDFSWWWLENINGARGLI